MFTEIDFVASKHAFAPLRQICCISQFSEQLQTLLSDAIFTVINQHPVQVLMHFGKTLTVLLKPLTHVFVTYLIMVSKQLRPSMGLSDVVSKHANPLNARSGHGNGAFLLCSLQCLPKPDAPLFSPHLWPLQGSSVWPILLR